MTLADSIKTTLDSLPDDAEGAVLQLDIEGDLNKQSVGLVFKKTSEDWRIVASFGLEHVKGQPIDAQVKVSVLYAF